MSTLSNADILKRFEFYQSNPKGPRKLTCPDHTGEALVPHEVEDEVTLFCPKETCIYFQTEIPPLCLRPIKEQENWRRSQ